MRPLTTRPLTTGAVLFAGAILALAAVACGGGTYSGGAAAKTTASAAPTRAVAATPAAAGGKTTVDVAAADFSFDPTTFTVAAGEDVTVTLKNGGRRRTPSPSTGTRNLRIRSRAPKPALSQPGARAVLPPPSAPGSTASGAKSTQP